MDFGREKDYPGWLIFYFLYTTFFSILQLPASPVSGIFTSYGGNYTSGNGLGVFRSNGGLGGTVIMYSNYLLTVFLILFYKGVHIVKYKYLLWFVFLIAVLLCFSRSLFLSVFIILSLHLCFKRPGYFLLLATFGVITLYVNLPAILEVFNTMVGDSDKNRISSWLLIIQNADPLTSLLGQRTGANTGFYIDKEVRKITADSFLLAWFYDYGLLGLGMLMALLWRAVAEAQIKPLGHFAVFVAVLLMMFVNSGFDKTFIIVMYFVTFMALKNRANLRFPDANLNRHGRIKGLEE